MRAVDTNVLIYAQDPRDSRKQAIAQELIASLVDGVMLWQVACEFVAASRKLEALGFARHSAFEVLARLRLVWDFVPPSCAVMDRAEQLVTGHGVAFWDAMIIAAIEAEIETLYTEDMPSMPNFGGLRIVDPFRVLL